MSAAVYRARNGQEFVIKHVPRGYAPPESVLLQREKDGHIFKFTYRGTGECGAHIAHGPGHQSHARCEAVGTHSTHHASGYEWTDKDMRPTPTGPNWGNMAERYGPTMAYSSW